MVSRLKNQVLRQNPGENPTSERSGGSQPTFQPSVRDQKFLQSNCHVSRETMELFQVYVDLLVYWQKKTNLVANSTLGEIWHRHICDSAQYKLIFPTKRKWLDIGSGAGFPGLVLAILGRDQPGFHVQMVESNGKKAAFLRKIIRETAVPASVCVERIESVAKQFDQCEVVTARAVSSLNNLFNLTSGWLEKDAVGLFPKGREYLQELEECRGRWEFDLIKHNSQIEENSVVLEIRNLKKTGK